MAAIELIVDGERISVDPATVRTECPECCGRGYVPQPYEFEPLPCPVCQGKGFSLGLSADWQELTITLRRLSVV